MAEDESGEKTDQQIFRKPQPGKRLECSDCGHKFTPRKLKPYHSCDQCGSRISRGKKVVAYFMFEANGGRLYE